MNVGGKQEKKIGLGSLQIPLTKKQYFTVYGGPFKECPNNMIGIKMAKEISNPSTISIPTEDFSIPDTHDLTIGLSMALDFLLAGDPLYIGCMGGKGRTGLFLAILAKAFGVKNPVEYVRKHYYAHAVETRYQYAFVMEYKVPTKLIWDIKVQKIAAWAFKPKGNLTNLRD